MLGVRGETTGGWWSGKAPRWWESFRGGGCWNSEEAIMGAE